MEQMTIRNRDMLDALKSTNRLARAEGCFTVFEHVLLQSQNDGVKIIGGNLVTQVQIHLDTEIPNAINHLINGKRLFSVLSQLPKEEELTIEITDTNLKLNRGSSRFRLRAERNDHQPYPLKTVAETAEIFTIRSMDFRNSLRMVSHAQANQDVRNFLNGVFFEVGDTLELTASNGHQLAHVSCPVQNAPENNTDFIVPRQTIETLERLLPDNDNAVSIRRDKETIEFVFGDMRVLSTTIAGTFPKYRRLLPNGGSTEVSLAREDLKQAAHRVSVLGCPPVRLSFEAQTLIMQATGANDNEGFEETVSLAAPVNNPFVIGVNSKYLLQNLEACPYEQLILKYTSPSEALLLCSPKHPSDYWVIMPVRL